MLVTSRNRASAARPGFLTPASLIILLLLLSGGGVGNDLVSLLPAEDYFAAREIDMSVEKMMELAVKDPNDGKAQIQQLLALRVLGDDAARVKKSRGFDEHLKLLEEIAAGKKAQDKLGFARVYAEWTVGRLKGKASAVLQPAPRKLAESALSWFPDGLSVVAAFEARPGIGQSNEFKDLAHLLIKKVPERKLLYHAVEELGNIRVDRVAVGFLADAQNENSGSFYFRLSGKADHEVLARFFFQKIANPKVKTVEGPNGASITIFEAGKHEPALALVGDSDMILALKDRDNLNNPDVRQMLEVRAGKKASVLKGALGDDLKKVSERANGLLVGTLPKQLLREFNRPESPLKIVPASFLFESEQKADGVEFRFRGKLANGNDAKAFHEELLKLRGQALTYLKLHADEVPFPVDGITKILRNAKMEAREDHVTASILVPTEAAVSLLNNLLKAKNLR